MLGEIKYNQQKKDDDVVIDNYTIEMLYHCAFQYLSNLFLNTFKDFDGAILSVK